MKGGSLAGRLALWLLQQRFKLERGQATQVEMTRLMAHKFDGDLELYLDGLDTILLQFQKEPEESFLLALVEPQLRKAKFLAPDFVFYDRALPDSEERTFTFLYDAARRQVQRRRTELNRDALTAPPKVAAFKVKGAGKGKDKKAAPDVVKKPCLFFPKATGCKFGEACYMSHEAGPPKAAEAVAYTPLTLPKSYSV